MQRKIVITGGIGSGKSTVAKILIQKGYCVWDADAFSREALLIEEVEKKIKKLFGDNIFFNKGKLNRDLLRKKIFSSQKARKSLEEIIHPYIFKIYQSKVKMMADIAPTAWIFYEAALILELGRKHFFDACILVTADHDTKIERLYKNRNLLPTESKKIINSQMSDDKKISYSNYIIENSGPQENLEQSVNQILDHLREKFSLSPL
jgi:dephospho-CoA kinase